MARKPNYGYEKRQKELAKKAKKEEKKKSKLEDDALESPEGEHAPASQEDSQDSPEQVNQ
jgi:hypothetical protein